MKKSILVALLAMSPIMTLAAGANDGLTTLLGDIGKWVTLLGKIIFAAVVVAFFWGLLMFVFGSEDKRESGKSMMIWGVVAIFVMSSIWGIVGFLQDSTGTGDGTAPAAEDVIPEIL